MLEKLAELVTTLGFDYDRMSTSGQQTYDEIVQIVLRMEAEKERNNNG